MSVGILATAGPEDVVVVGVDGSESSERALAWAMDFAVENGCVLDVVTVWPPATAVMIHDVPGHCAPRESAWSTQRRLLDQVCDTRAAMPRVRRHLVNARPVEALVTRSAGRRLLVVGSDRADPTQRARGSISDLCDTQARCPVMVVRESVRRVPTTGDLRP